MKLIFCKSCHDVKRIHPEFDTKCKCGKSGGRYKVDGINATYWGDAVPLGFLNASFALAVTYQPEEGDGYGFRAFVIPKKCDTFVKSD